MFTGPDKNKPKDTDVKQLVDLGFNKDEAINALKSEKNVERAAELLFNIASQKVQDHKIQNQNQNLQPIQRPRNNLINGDVLDEYERQMQKAVEDSLKLAQNFQISHSNNQLNQQLINYEPLNPDQRERFQNEPVGLKNIGNTCYFNSLIQAYFYLPDFTEKILTSSVVQQIGLQSSNIEREKACHYLVINLAYLFSKLILTNQKYTEPSEVLRSLVDDFGQPILLGEQKDIGEFNLNFLERIEEGLGERIMAKRLVEEEKKQEESKDIDHQFEQIPTSDTTPDISIRKSSIADDTPDNISPSRIMEPEIIFNRPSNNIDNLQDPSHITKSVILQNQDDIKNSHNSIYNMFFGRTKQILKVDNSSRSKVFNTKTEKMGPIMIDIDNHSNLYEAWNSQHVEQIQDFNCQEVAKSFFETPGEVTSGQENPVCIKETWIEDLPSVLMFTLKRVNYDYKTQSLIKNNKKFQFEKSVYADKFVYSNKDRDQKLNQIVDKLLEKQRKIQNELQKMRDHRNGLGVIDILDEATNLISKEEVDQQNWHDVNLGQDQQKSELQIALQYIQRAKEQTLSRIQDYENQLLLVKNEIQNVQTSLQQEKFNLHAILIHQGSGDQGHYYAFIFDRNQQKWFRFNDYKVTEESEDTVFEEGFGNTTTKTSAYGLIYVNEEIAQKQYQQSLFDLNKSLESKVIPQLQSQIKKDNYKYTVTLNSFKLEKIAQKIKEQFCQRSEKITQLINQYDSPLQTDLINYNCFLIKKHNKVQLAKWQLLNQCFKENHPASLDLTQVERDDPILTKVEMQIPNLYKSMNKDGQDFLKWSSPQFLLYQSKATILRYVLKNLSDKGWLQAVKAMRFYKKSFIDGQPATSAKDDDGISNIMIDVNRTFVLHCCTMINFNITKQNTEKMLEFLKIAVVDCLLLIDPSDQHFKQIIYNTSFSYEKVQQIFDKNIVDQFEFYKSLLTYGDSSVLDPDYLQSDNSPVSQNSNPFFQVFFVLNLLNLQPYQELKQEIEKITKQDLNIYNEEGSSSKSIAWQFNSSLKIFKDTFKSWISIHNRIIKDKRALTPAEWCKFEEQMGIVLPPSPNKIN
eukprot:403353129